MASWLYPVVFSLRNPSSRFGLCARLLKHILSLLIGLSIVCVSFFDLIKILGDIITLKDTTSSCLLEWILESFLIHISVLGMIPNCIISDHILHFSCWTLLLSCVLGHPRRLFYFLCVCENITFHVWIKLVIMFAILFVVHVSWCSSCFSENASCMLLLLIIVWFVLGWIIFLRSKQVKISFKFLWIFICPEVVIACWDCSWSRL